MGYSAYGSFADILRQAKAQSQLRGTPFSNSAIKSMGQGYFADALDASNTDRAYNLANTQQTLAEKAQATDEEQFNKSYNLSSSQFAQSLAQQRAMMDAQKGAADKATMQGYANTGVSGLGMGAMALKGSGVLASTFPSLFAPTAAEAAIGATPAAAVILGDMAAAQLPGYAGTLGANAALTGAEAIGGTAAESELLGSSGGILGSGLGGLGAAGAGMAGTVAPIALNAIHKDSTENIGHNVTFGLIKDEKTASTVGGGVTGAAAGAVAGAAATAWSGPGAIVGAVIGAIGGAVSGGSWLCTEIEKRYGMDDADIKTLSKLRRYSIKNHKEWARKYLKEGYRLVDAMNAKEGIDDKYQALKDSLVTTVCDLVRGGQMEEAHNVYKDVTLSLCAEYGVEP